MRVLKRKLGFSLCSLLLALAPVLAVNMQSAYFWGEVDIPESLIK
jgi:hypothetical protein